MTGSRKPATAGFWITVALVAVLVGYPLSFGPACWLCERGHVEGHATWMAYRPVTLLWAHGPRFTSRAIYWWADLGRHSRGSFFPPEPLRLEFNTLSPDAGFI